jgi:hypothetical protein
VAKRAAAAHTPAAALFPVGAEALLPALLPAMSAPDVRLQALKAAAEVQAAASLCTFPLISKCHDICTSLVHATTLGEEVVNSIRSGDVATASAAATGMLGLLTLTQASMAALEAQVRHLEEEVATSLRRFEEETAATSSLAAASSSGDPVPQGSATTSGLGAANIYLLPLEQQEVIATAAARPRSASRTPRRTRPAPLGADFAGMDFVAEAQARGFTLVEILERRRRGELS